MNATALLREWEEMLEPVRALRNVAPDCFAEDVEWILGERFANAL